MMDDDRDKMAIERQLRRCRELTTDYPDGPTAQHLRELERELSEKLKSLTFSRTLTPY